MHGIRRDIFDTDTPTRMSKDEVYTLIARKDLGVARKVMTLAHQSRAALADGDIEQAAALERLAAAL